MKTRQQLRESSSSSSDDMKVDIEKHNFLTFFKSHSVNPNETIRIPEHVDFYHPTYNTKGVAVIPDYMGAGSDDQEYMDKEDQESSIFLEMDPDSVQTHEELIANIFQWSKLSLEKTLQLWAFCEFDALDTVALIDKVCEPELLPAYVKDYFQASILEERFYQLNKKHEDIRRFHFASMFENIVDSKMLVDLYYREKNKQVVNWHLESEKDWGPNEIIDLEKRMKNSKIKIISVKAAESCKRKMCGGLKKRPPLAPKKTKIEVD
ncbi:Protein CBG07293 [Caenorhabditis briggsae]|uniref:Protein CBG07293 n=2 Tax=Caenorhabditis briggsae TaxID=6238 RepID=A8X524_CAEBR|nr:Protein CBG07293 [Caenorhabditis briggsae]ULT85005.1 hypothetical protein L3Y34_013590 [Caenorhabditis briggsae]CAP27734.2 Protein CBG07293 [Caenorhabditis briggsae]